MQRSHGPFKTWALADASNATTGLVYTGRCTVGNMVFSNRNDSGANISNFKVYDGVDDTGTVVFDIDVPSAAYAPADRESSQQADGYAGGPNTISIPGDWNFDTGIFVDSSAGCHTTIQYIPRGANE